LIDQRFDNNFKRLIIGVDEAGRGPFAGPVIAAACHIPSNASKFLKLELINDSKKLSHKTRIKSYNHLIKLKKKSIIKIGIGSASVNEIDKFNILNATFLAMSRALKIYNLKNFLVLIDGNKCPVIKNAECKAVIQGDQKSISISAASIIAKNYRDMLMIKLSNSFPEYGWDHNMGYGTKKHTDAIEKYGINEHHRKSFSPIKRFIQNIS
tara:strand:+ start:746 stop:1375 length:630 start_codon:yes stop_codon:yes gene_type:complete